MNRKTHVRSYAMTGAGDIRVTHWNKGEVVDLSRYYEGVSYDRHHARVETSLEVFRDGEGRMSWALAPNGYDVESAITIRLLLGLFLDDVLREVGDPAGF